MFNKQHWSSQHLCFFLKARCLFRLCLGICRSCGRHRDTAARHHTRTGGGEWEDLHVYVVAVAPARHHTSYPSCCSTRRCRSAPSSASPTPRKHPSGPCRSEASSTSAANPRPSSAGPAGKHDFVPSPSSDDTYTVALVSANHLAGGSWGRLRGGVKSTNGVRETTLHKARPMLSRVTLVVGFRFVPPPPQL